MVRNAAYLVVILMMHANNAGAVNSCAIECRTLEEKFHIAHETYQVAAEDYEQALEYYEREKTNGRTRYLKTKSDKDIFEDELDMAEEEYLVCKESCEKESAPKITSGLVENDRQYGLNK